MKKLFQILKIPILIGVIFFAIFRSYQTGKKGKKQYQTFNSANLHGELTYKFRSTGAIYMRVAGSDKEYMFMPLNNTIDGRDFYSAAKILRDTILKPAYHDTLYLIKYEGSRYPFVFKKLE